MKGGGISSYNAMPGKRRWSWLVIAVLGLVLLSMLVPLAFLLGLHNGFHSVTNTGYFHSFLCPRLVKESIRSVSSYVR